jgi:RND family efflux transporter MFP subunit
MFQKEIGPNRPDMESQDLSKLKIEKSDRGPARPERRSKRVIWRLLAAAAVLGTAAILVNAGLLVRPIEVRATAAAQTSVARALTVLNASGYVVAQRKAAVSSKATGRLARLHVEEGKYVRKGDLIATLENDDLKATLEEAGAGLKVAAAALKNAEAELEDATPQYHRHKTLRAAEAISAQGFDAVEARYKKALASEKTAKFAVERAEALVRVSEVNLEYSLIRAPFDGVILTKNADEGEVVAPFGGSLNAKAAVVTMADMDSLLVEVDVSESHLEKAKPGGACEIRLDALPRDRFPGVVHMIVPTADRSKATVLTKVRFLTLDKRALPEMSAKVAFLSRPLEAGENDPFLGIPATAVKESEGEKTIFRVNSRRVVAVPVKIGRRWGETVEVLSGVKEGDLVVVSPGSDLRDGSVVKMLE